MASLFRSKTAVFGTALALRLALILYGIIQDAVSPLKYTDIDYFVFRDAARFVSRSQPPYERATYRYTPLLAWLMYPTVWEPSWLWGEFGKLIFAGGDLAAGHFIVRVLQEVEGMETERALKFASIWLLNPMVAQISTRGSSEGLLCAVVVALLWAVVTMRTAVAGALLGFAVHFKIYPFIYAAAIIWWMDDKVLWGQAQAKTKPTEATRGDLRAQLSTFCNRSRLEVAMYSFVTFMGLNVLMFQMYGRPFLEHSYFYHLSRTDHRHNFSPYNILLYQNSIATEGNFANIATFAFVPQMLLCLGVLPLSMAKKDLPTTMMAQTYAFVTFNKVCTSQYFLWYLVFLPFYLPRSTLLAQPKKGLIALGLWVGGQAVWLSQGYQLEFLGNAVFAPEMWLASILFFLINVWLLGTVVDDVVNDTRSSVARPIPSAEKAKKVE